MSFHSLEELEARQVEIQARLESMSSESRGRVFTDDEKKEWNGLNEERESNMVIAAEWRAREDLVASLAGNDLSIERGAHFNAPRKPQDIYDLVGIRQQARTVQEEAALLRDNARRAVEQTQFPHPEANREDAQGHIERLISRFGDSDDDGAEMSRFCHRVLSTGSEMYRRAFGKAVMGRALNPEESRALSVATTGGGFAVPFSLDPTIIPTSNLSVNPYRAISRVETITGTTWQGVTSAGVTVQYQAEAAEGIDNSPALAQPTVTPVRCTATIPFSIEISQDWGAMQSEMASLIQDGKDDVEATKFTLGGGTNEPFGLLTGATTVVTGAATATFAIGDVYSTEQALGPRFRPRAQWLANRGYYNLVRQFDTGGGGGLWMQLPRGLDNNVPTAGNIGASLLGYPANECSAVVSTTTTGSLPLVIGDFRYFLIVDRIGMDVELVPHLFGGSGRPLGQRAIYAFWRNSSKVIDANAFRVYKVK